ncbi:MAG TPA: hypothetical protein VMV45_04705 [Casimicrobiaceae bacterium]|nr:hypothetical protein [Casimicrobiaceae bacterium]
MKRQAAEYRRPYRSGDYALVRDAGRGVYWERGDGLVVRMADVERRQEPQRLGPWWEIFNAMSSSRALAR